MTTFEAILLLAGGLTAGTINSIAGGGSLLTVPLLVLAGVPGNMANGSNRIGVLLSNGTAVISFQRLGVSGLQRSLPVLVPTCVGSLLGSLVVSQLSDATFERVFGIVMIPLLVLALRRPKPSARRRAWPTWLTVLVFFAIGLYGGGFQAGVGLFLVLALAYSGVDLVLANSIKVVVTFVLTAIALPVFIANGLVDWGPALVLGAGFAAGGWLGALVAVRGGERVIRPVMTLAVFALAGRMVGLY